MACRVLALRGTSHGRLHARHLRESRHWVVVESRHSHRGTLVGGNSSGLSSSELHLRVELLLKEGDLLLLHHHDLLVNHLLLLGGKRGDVGVGNLAYGHTWGLRHGTTHHHGVHGTHRVHESHLLLLSLGGSVGLRRSGLLLDWLGLSSFNIRLNLLGVLSFENLVHNGVSLCLSRVFLFLVLSLFHFSVSSVVHLLGFNRLGLGAVDHLVFLVSATTTTSLWFPLFLGLALLSGSTFGSSGSRSFLVLGLHCCFIFVIFVGCSRSTFINFLRCLNLVLSLLNLLSSASRCLNGIVGSFLGLFLSLSISISFGLNLTFFVFLLLCFFSLLATSLLFGSFSLFATLLLLSLFDFLLGGALSLTLLDLLTTFTLDALALSSLLLSLLDSILLSTSLSGLPLVLFQTFVFPIRHVAFQFAVNFSFIEVIHVANARNIVLIESSTELLIDELHLAVEDLHLLVVGLKLDHLLLDGAIAFLNGGFLPSRARSGGEASTIILVASPGCTSVVSTRVSAVRAVITSSVGAITIATVRPITSTVGTVTVSSIVVGSLRVNSV